MPAPRTGGSWRRCPGKVVEGARGGRRRGAGRAGRGHRRSDEDGKRIAGAARRACDRRGRDRRRIRRSWPRARGGGGDRRIAQTMTDETRQETETAEDAATTPPLAAQRRSGHGAARHRVGRARPGCGRLVSAITDRPRPERAAAGRTGRLQIHRAADAHRPAVDPHLRPGEFVVEDLVIEGLTPTDRPFLHGRQIVVSMTVVDAVHAAKSSCDSVEMTDWQMLVETSPNGRHNFPNSRRKHAVAGPEAVHDHDAELVRAHRGQFTYEDHGTPWSIVAPQPRGRRSTKPARLSAGGQLLRRHHPDSVVRADAGRHASRLHDRRRQDPLRPHRPAQRRRAVRGRRRRRHGALARADLPRAVAHRLPAMREIFFARDKFSLFGDRDFTGTFHLFKGGRELRGTFRQPACRGQRLPVSEPARIGDLAARRVSR